MNRSRRSCTIGVGFLLVFVSVACGDIRGEISRLIAPVSRYVSAYSVAVYSVGVDKMVVGINSDRLLIPASNQKLVTTISALAQLGEKFRFRTVLARRGEDVFIIADGDPTFAKFVDSEFVIEEWGKMLKRKGIVHIRDVVVDATVFDGLFYHQDWPKDQLGKVYVTPVSGLVINRNCFWCRVKNVGFRPTFELGPKMDGLNVVLKWIYNPKNKVTVVSPIWQDEDTLKINVTYSGKPLRGVEFPVIAPDKFIVGVIRYYFKKVGIEIVGGVKIGRVRTINGTLPADLEIISEVETPIIKVIKQTNKESINLYAECLFKRMGFSLAKRFVNFPVGSWITGRLAVEEFVELELGCSGDLVISDGSGLSRKNRLSVGFIVKLLNFAYKKWGSRFVNTLAIGGIDGTLRRRMKGICKGRVFGKTGYIDGVSALSGYVVNDDGEVRYIFSVIFNGFPKSKLWLMRQVQDKICRVLVTQSR